MGTETGVQPLQEVESASMSAVLEERQNGIQKEQKTEELYQTKCQTETEPQEADRRGVVWEGLETEHVKGAELETKYTRKVEVETKQKAEEERGQKGQGRIEEGWNQQGQSQNQEEIEEGWGQNERGWGLNKKGERGWGEAEEEGRKNFDYPQVEYLIIEEVK